jgi:DNA polymerase-3 subunit gamma/tau
MTYQVLARKWRPQDFNGVVGQAPVVTALRNGLSGNRVAQAYLFSGIRGVGKTSVARILAKALNCEKGPATDPCNECRTCAEITAGSDLDVIEVDAATYSKVEQVRDLTESLKYGPARDRYKVVIIDEIHRLSRQAFDALLKIVEEPPPHLVFVFATTEAEAVPATILSRCQEHRFRRVPAQGLADHLATIARAEEIEISEAALRLLARAGDGSVRDAVALLDQLATYGAGTISDEEAARLLGGVDHALFHKLLTAIAGGDAAGVSEVVAEVEDQGWDPRHVFSEFLSYCRDGLHLALGADSVDLPGEEAQLLRSLAEGAGYENLLRILSQLLGSEGTVRHSESGALALEVAWLRAAELPKLTRIEEILGGGPSGSSGASNESRRGTRGSAKSGRKAAPAAQSSRRPRAARRTTVEPSTEPAPPRAEAPPPKAASAPAPEPPHPEPPDAEPPGPTPPSEELAPASREASAPAEIAAPLATERAEDLEAVETAAETPPEPASQPAPQPAPELGAPAETAGEAASSNGGAPPATVERFLEEVSKRRESLAAHLRSADRLSFEAGLLEIRAPHEDPLLNQQRLQRAANRAILDAALAEVWGEDARWKLAYSAPKDPSETTAPTPAAPVDVLHDPRVQTVLDIFGGSVESVVENESPGDR